MADYIRGSGAIGKLRTISFCADIRGHIHSTPDRAWMSFTGTQVNTYGENPQRMFLMHATRSGLPVEVLHLYRDATATMQVKVLSAFPIVNAKGPEMDCAETVTPFRSWSPWPLEPSSTHPSDGRPATSTRYPRLWSSTTDTTSSTSSHPTAPAPATTAFRSRNRNGQRHY